MKVATRHMLHVMEGHLKWTPASTELKATVWNAGVGMKVSHADTGYEGWHPHWVYIECTKVSGDSPRRWSPC